MKWGLSILAVVSILIGIATGFVLGASQPGFSADPKPIEIEVIDSKMNARGDVEAIRRYANYGGGLLYTEVRIEIALKKADQECIIYSREGGKNQNAKYEWSPDNTLKIEDHLPYESAAMIRRCFATPMHFVEFEASKM